VDQTVGPNTTLSDLCVASCRPTARISFLLPRTSRGKAAPSAPSSATRAGSPTQRGPHAAGALYRSRVSRESEVAANETRAAVRRRSMSGSGGPGGGRAGLTADAMRSTPRQRAAGKRARRFRAATSDPVIRVAQPHARRISAPDMCRPHASVVAAAPSAYEPRAISRRAERRRLSTPLARRSAPLLSGSDKVVLQLVSKSDRGWRRTGCPARRGAHTRDMRTWASTSWGGPPPGPACDTGFETNCGLAWL
jgi:hypothetical protein